MSLSVKYNGSFSEVSSVNVKTGGSWTEAEEVFVKYNGIWRSVWTNTFTHTISGAFTNLNLRDSAISAGWNGSSELLTTITSGSVISGSSSAFNALLVDGSFPNGLIIINNGNVIGFGGNGAPGGDASGRSYANNGVQGAPGRAGIRVDASAPYINIDNQGIIAGGGGGGGGGAGGYAFNTNTVAGGEDADPTYTYDVAVAGGSGGSGGRTSSFNRFGGSGGDAINGDVMADGQNGSGGTYSSAGGTTPGQRAVIDSRADVIGGTGGAGGNWGASGSNGSPANIVFAPDGSDSGAAGVGGNGGNAIVGNSQVTWINTGTRFGGIAG